MRKIYMGERVLPQDLTTRVGPFLGSSSTGSYWLFVRMSFGKILHRPSLEVVKPRKDMNNVSCSHDLTEIILKMA